MELKLSKLHLERRVIEHLHLNHPDTIHPRGPVEEKFGVCPPASRGRSHVLVPFLSVVMILLHVVSTRVSGSDLDTAEGVCRLLDQRGGGAPRYNGDSSTGDNQTLTQHMISRVGGLGGLLLTKLSWKCFAVRVRDQLQRRMKSSICHIMSQQIMGLLFSC